jgi:hypothetical protein
MGIPTDYADFPEFTTDTRKEHCPIRIMYVTNHGHAPVGPYYASELYDRPHMAGFNVMPIAIIRATEHGDYSGGSVEASNYRAMLANEDMKPNLVEIYGSHGYQALAYDATLGPVPDSWEIANALDGFENHYPLFDEDDHSELECELETEAWDDHGRSDFRRKLEVVLDTLDGDHEHELPDDDEPYSLPICANPNTCSDPETWKAFLWDLWRAGCDELNVNGGTGFVIETGSLVHFYIDDWAAKAGTDSRYKTDKPIHNALRALAEATRIAEEG